MKKYYLDKYGQFTTEKENSLGNESYTIRPFFMFLSAVAVIVGMIAIVWINKDDKIYDHHSDYRTFRKEQNTHK